MVKQVRPVIHLLLAPHSRNETLRYGVQTISIFKVVSSLRSYGHLDLAIRLGNLIRLSPGYPTRTKERHSHTEYTNPRITYIALPT